MSSSIVDAARRMAATFTADPGSFDDQLCPCVCDVTYVVQRDEAGFVYPQYSHAPNCPTLALPAIVAALEAIPKALELLEEWSPWSGEYGEIMDAQEVLKAALGKS